tara:strand:+ start:327 stop:1112 length:786 start_codon:yes stop_codon:yes gene_type:complete
MLTFILLAFFAGLPILAYLLASKTKSKGIIFGLSAIILSVCLFIYISKFSILGSLNKQILKNKIVDEIYVNSKIATQNLVSIENVLEKDEIQIWLISLISKAIELNKLTSAESLVTFSEKFFDSNEEKLIFYNMYTSLRDAKFPEFSNASFKISGQSNYPCSFTNGEIRLFILNGPEIPIGEKIFSSQESIEITNRSSLIPGFDLASAYLNNETIEMNISINCENNSNIFYINNLIVLSLDTPFISYKIEPNEWLKKPQEL